MLDLSRSAAKPKVGEVVNIIPNHCCVVSNMVDEVYGIRDGTVEVTWPRAQGCAERRANRGSLLRRVGDDFDLDLAVHDESRLARSSAPASPSPKYCA